jgi:hypothetical protein
MVAISLCALIRVLQNLVALAGGACDISGRSTYASCANPSEKPAKPGISLTH